MSLLSIIRTVKNDIEIHEYYKDIMEIKYARKPTPRYRCELNKLNRLLYEKHVELKRLTMQHDENRTPKIFFSKKYLPKLESTCDRNNDRPNKDKSDYREGLAAKIVSSKKYHTQKSPLTRSTSDAVLGNDSKDTSKIFYSQKYRAKFEGSCQKDQLTKNTTGKRNEDNSIQLGKSQFEKFKNMYLKWVKKN